MTVYLIILEVVLAVLGVTGALFLALIAYVLHAQGEWRRRGVATLKSPLPFIGNFGEMILRRKAFPYVVKDIYNGIIQMGKKFAGTYQFSRPLLFISDPNLISEVTVKNFEHFTDRRPFADGVDDMLSRSLLNLKGEEWRDMRHQLSPAFTASKLRGMLGLIDNTCRQLTQYLTTRANPEEPLDVYETSRRFAADVIATTAFGTTSDSLNKKHSHFYDNGIKLMDFKGIRGLIFTGYIMVPSLMQLLKIPFIPQSLADFFRNTILSTIHYRERENKSRPDMVQLLLDARKTQNSKISDKDIIAQAFTFFLGGFDTIATALSFCIQLIAMHPDVQTRLREEVEEAFKKGGGTISYEDLHELTYMDMVISEVLRMYPSAPMVDRRCTKSFELPEYNFYVEKGLNVGVPIFGLHHDPQFFPDPERFNPERFSEENKAKIKSFTYLPFGIGPRNCIGLRFAQLEVKLCLAHILSNVDLEVCSRTKLPIQISAESTQMKPEGGFWVTARPRRS